MSRRRIRNCHNIFQLRELARRRLPAPVFHYLEGGADDEVTLARNVDSFDNYEFLPRTLVDVSAIDTSVEILGQKIDWPVITSPTSMHRLFHHEGEAATARAAHRAGTIFSMSTLATTSIEDIAPVTPGPKMFQIYVQRDRAPVKETIERCRAAGFKALCLTVDVPVAGNRERDIHTGMTIPPKLSLMSLLDIAMHPRWCLDYLTHPGFQMANLVHLDEKSGGPNSLAKYVSQIFDRSVTWQDAEWMVKEWDGPFAIKGIISVDDARRVADIGATAVIISNHGGRQLDGLPAAIDMVSEIAGAVGDRIEIILDGGIRRGSHILKALALGAKACMVGRCCLYGLGAAGEAGVDRALAILREEFERNMTLLGCRSIGEISTNHIRRAH